MIGKGADVGGFETCGRLALADTSKLTRTGLARQPVPARCLAPPFLHPPGEVPLPFFASPV